MIIQTNRKTGTGHAAAHAASVDDTADVEPCDPDSELVDTTEHINQDLNKHEESSHDADSDPCFDDISEDNAEDELEPWVDYITRATHKADNLLTASGITLWILRQKQTYWRQARMFAKHHEDRWTNLVHNWNPAVSTKRKGVPETRKTGQEMGRRPQHPLVARRIQQRQHRSDERHDLAHYGGRKLEMGCRGT